ncbi:efflux RND transporter permease subunit [Chachezhania antarctica]|uniref:efflux RND transporter permease subunit n=1 Tax=Chachezhania antarctica TaxID=2340860 RepID=UPI000EB4A780|nr:multidrug efflux RND transporter permease subunit [Chachezhania antarctica]|tara:strand:+ start:435 stop:3596 length:3162 start_codon:yes stop_codon:yes gene_type:complete
MFSALFIDRPKLAMVISLVLTIMGAIGYFALPVAQFPNITPPVVNVSATYTGASAETVETSVAAPIEAQVNGVDGMMYMTSTSSDSGSYSLTVLFEIGTDPDIAAVNVQNRVAQATPSLPSDVTQSGVVTELAATDMLMVVGLVSPKDSYDAIFLSNYAAINIVDALSRVDGVGKVQLFTQQDYAMRMWLKPDTMAGLGLVPSDVIAAIQDQNIEVSAGQIGAPPIPEGQAFQYTIKAQGRLTTAEEFGNIIVRTGENGAIVQVKDIARVELGASFYGASGHYDGQPATVMALYQTPGANALAVAEAATAELERLAGNFPDDIDYVIPMNATDFVVQSMNDVILTLGMTFALVVAVVFVFLGNARATLIPMVAIPVSLIGTLAFLLVFGMSLNTISMFALVLAIGIVVDDAIIVVENVERIMREEGLDARAATRKAMGQITGPIIATSLVLLAVFAPVGFMPGIAGKLYSQFAVTISVAVVISSINALTLSPALAALVLKPSSEPKGLLAVFERAISGMRSVYVGIVRTILRVSIVALVAVAGLAAATTFLLDRTSTGFIPLEDNGILFVDMQLPDAAALDRTEAVARRVAQDVAGIDGVRSTVQVSGYSFLNGQAPNAAMVIVDLKPWDDRQTEALSAQGILDQINAIAAQEVSARIVAFNPPPIPGLGLSSGVEMQVQQTDGGTPQDLAAAVGSLVYAANQRSEIAQSYSSFSAAVPQIQLDLDREKAKLLGVAVSDVFLTLQSYLGSFYVNDFNRFGRVYRVMIQAEGAYRDKIEDIDSLYVRSAGGDMVRLSTLVEVKDVLGPSTLTRHNQFRSASVTGVQAEGLSTGDAIRVMEEVAQTALPDGYTYQWTGAALQQQGTSGTILALLGLAILFGYLFLVGQYESWTMPMAIILSVLVALFGAVAAVAVAGSDINLYTQIGMIMLVGMASKNGILIVEFAMQERATGKTISEAAAIAAHQRFRAVMMTALSFLLGVVPLVIASGAGAASQKALGIAVFGGMLAAATLGVLVVPGLFAVMQWSRETVKSKLGVGKAAPEDTVASQPSSGT